MARMRRGKGAEDRFSDVPFITDWRDTTRVFDDLDHVEKVDDLPRMLDQWRQEPFGPGEGGVEAAVGRVETAEAAVLSVLARHARAVCRISVPPGPYTDFRGLPADESAWTGTGFLVSRNLLLTNHHVLNSVAVAEAATAEFDFQVSESDLLDGPPDETPAATVFRLNPRRLFVTSSMQDLDFSFVWIEAAAAEAFGTIRMTRGSFVVRQTEPVYIVHHPNGDPKQVSLDDTEVLSMNAAALLYAADTEGGSSGAPVFCKRGRLVGLHHAWRSTQAAKTLYPTLTGRLNDGTFTDVVNEGIKLAAMAIDLERRIAAGGEDASAAATVLAAFGGSDTLTGLFGSLGRHGADAGDDGALPAYQQVLQVYRGREMDIDVGAWNVAWFDREHSVPGKCDFVAKVITDLNLDIWTLIDVSPKAVTALVAMLQAQYNQEYRVAFSDPGAPGDAPGTAVMWRPNVVEGESVAWPEEIDRLLRQSSSETPPVGAVGGPIFNRYPGLFRFRLQSDTKAFEIFLVPLHLEAQAEGSLRRRLASKVLSHAVQRMIEAGGAERDWLLLGDVNATLAREDFRPLVARGFAPLSAADEANGAFTYLKSPRRSLLEKIFVSENLSRQIDQKQFFIVPTDRSVGRFVSGIADQRPIATRLALADLPETAPGEAGPTAAPADEDAAFAALLTAAGLDHAPPTTPAPPPASAAPADWVTAGLTKTEFLRANGPRLAREIAAINAGAGAGAVPLTAEDVAAVFMAEAGIAASGRLDPGFVHSNGEHGLLPLPDNIAFWIGPGAPAHDAPMLVEANLRAYLAYLAALKSKPVKTLGARRLYPDLFREPGIAGRPDRGAKLLAGVVHGYFWEGNYADRTVPLEYLLAGFGADVALGPLLAQTGYVHAGKPLLDGRQRNLEAGLALAGALAST
jgi:hypothetical protein